MHEPTTAEGAHDADVVLKDGSTLHVRSLTRDDSTAVHDLFQHLSFDSLHNRFGGFRVPTLAEATRLCCTTPAEGFALAGERGGGLVAVVEYHMNPSDRTSAEVALAVADQFQARGVGTRMLEELATIARGAGVVTFEAEVLATNDQMLRVFEDSGFSVHEETAAGTTRVRLSLEDTPTRAERAAARGEVAATASMRTFFEPTSVAVVGANRERGHIGAEILTNLQLGAFNGRICAINPRLTTTPTVPAYPSLRDVPFQIDLAVIAVPAPQVETVVDDCIAKGVRALIVISAGFGETNTEGRARETALLAKVRAAGIRMIGPNCMGLINTNPKVRLNATFAPGVPPHGRIAFSSQSGALGLAILDYLRHLHMGLSTFVSVGNKADVSSNDLIQYWADDPDTDVILLYLESFGNPRTFGRLARRIGRRKPIVAVKAGRSVSGARAATSHTGALTATDSIVDALFKQSGVIRTDTLEEMFDVARLLAHEPLPQGRRVAIITNAGGPGILAADACEARGLTLPSLSSQTVAALRAFLPNAASVANPVDMLATATASDYARTIPLVLADPAIDSILIIFTPPLVTNTSDVARAVVESTRGATKPVLATFMTAAGTAAELASIPCYVFPESAARALGHVIAYADWRCSPVGKRAVFTDTQPQAAQTIIDRALAAGGGWLTPDDAASVLKAFRIPVVSTVAATTVEEAVAAAGQCGYPVALKAAGPTIVHKTERHGVALALADEHAVRTAYQDLRARFGTELTAVLVQPMIPQGVEMLVGASLDPSLGHVVVCGSGGTLTELIRDTACRLHPLTDLDAAAMVSTTRGAALLHGFRGAPPADEAALREVLLRVSAMLDACPDILEMDINPVIVHAHGACAVDVRIRVGVLPPKPRSRRIDY
jgi:acetyl coenzyme A synthetase (ADP forming)-like protein